jgi:hypothetical protein
LHRERQARVSYGAYFAPSRDAPTALSKPDDLFEESPMIFALPVIGKIAAAYAASKTSASSTAQNIIQQNLQAGGGDTVNSASFAQTLNNVGQASGSTTSVSTAKI